MCTTTNRFLLSQLPFHQMTDFEVEQNFQTTKRKVLQLMNDHRLTEFIKENILDDLFDPNDIKRCSYYNEDEIEKLKLQHHF